MNKCDEYIIGIDPGRRGSICLFAYGSKRVSYIKMPYIYVEHLGEYVLDFTIISSSLLALVDKVKCVVVERPFIMPGNKNKGLMTQLADYGAVVNMMRYWFGIDKVVIVNAKQWKSVLGKQYAFKLDKDKASSIMLAKQLASDFVEPLVLRASSRCTTDDDNMAEAFLLANYGMLL